MNNCVASIGGLGLSAMGVIGMIDPSTAEGWLKTGAYGVGTALLVWQLLRAYKRQDQLQRQATEALQKCASCPLARDANQHYIESHDHHRD